MNATAGTQPKPEPPLGELLAVQSPRRRTWRRRAGYALLLLAALATAVLILRRSGPDAAGPGYRTEPVVTGTLVVTVSATGNLQPTNQVQVGSELSGIVEQVFVEENDAVEAGQVLARLDLSRLQDAVVNARATLQSAQAQVQQTRATAHETGLQLDRLQRVAKASGGMVPSQAELDAAEAAARRAEAGVAAARAGVAQARAALQSAETNLAKATIRSPIHGVVLSRSVEPGQTVAATLQAPVLFTLAEDLTKMELEVDVDEADVGQVEKGQRATFTVDAWPGRRFEAVITRVAYGSQIAEGVVSYPARLMVDNSELKLRPGMTATAEITTVTRDQALLVPNAALRFSPDEAARPSQRPQGGVLRSLMPRPPAQTMSRPSGAARNGPQRVWVLQDAAPVAVEVKTGASDGRVTEILGDTLRPGTEVITERTGASS